MSGQLVPYIQEYETDLLACILLFQLRLTGQLVLYIHSATIFSIHNSVPEQIARAVKIF